MHNSHGDADYLIILTATRKVVGDDTDLLVLLYHANSQSQSIFFKSEPKKGAKNEELGISKRLRKA